MAFDIVHWLAKVTIVQVGTTSISHSVFVWLCFRIWRSTGFALAAYRTCVLIGTRSEIGITTFCEMNVYSLGIESVVCSTPLEVIDRLPKKVKLGC